MCFHVHSRLPHAIFIHWGLGIDFVCRYMHTIIQTIQFDDGNHFAIQEAELVKIFAQ